MAQFLREILLAPLGPPEPRSINGVIVVPHGRGHAGTVNCVRYNEDSSVAMSGSIDCTVKCWDVKTKRQEPVQTFEETKVRLAEIEFVTARNYE